MPSMNKLFSTLFALALLICTPLFALIRAVQLWWNRGARGYMIRRALGKSLLYLTRMYYGDKYYIAYNLYGGPANEAQIILQNNGILTLNEQPQYRLLIREGNVEPSYHLKDFSLTHRHVRFVPDPSRDRPVLFLGAASYDRIRTHTIDELESTPDYIPLPRQIARRAAAEPRVKMALDSVAESATTLPALDHLLLTLTALLFSV